MTRYDELREAFDEDSNWELGWNPPLASNREVMYDLNETDVYFHLIESAEERFIEEDDSIGVLALQSYLDDANEGTLSDEDYETLAEHRNVLVEEYGDEHFEPVNQGDAVDEFADYLVGLHLPLDVDAELVDQTVDTLTEMGRAAQARYDERTA